MSLECWVCGQPPPLNHLIQVLTADRTAQLWCGVCPNDGYEVLKDAEGYAVHVYEDEAIGLPDHHYEKLGSVNVELLAAELNVDPLMLAEHLRRMESEGFIYRDDDDALVLLQPDGSVFARLHDR